MATQAEFLKKRIAAFEREFGPDDIILKHYRRQLSALESIKKDGAAQGSTVTEKQKKQVEVLARKQSTATLATAR